MNFFRPLRQAVTRFLKPVNWYNLKTTEPISRVFGFDRGTPVDRFFIDHFLNDHRNFVHGRILEVGEDTYSRRFASPGSVTEILMYNGDSAKSGISGDLTNSETLPENAFDCFICTQTINFIYDIRSAIHGIHRLLKPDGTALITAAGLSQISRYDMDRWGDYWRFTTLSFEKLFGEVFGENRVTVDCYGNVLAAVAFLHGLSADELAKEELLKKDEDYQILLTAVVRK